MFIFSVISKMTFLKNQVLSHHEIVLRITEVFIYLLCVCLWGFSEESVLSFAMWVLEKILSWLGLALKPLTSPECSWSEGDMSISNHLVICECKITDFSSNFFNKKGLRVKFWDKRTFETQQCFQRTCEMHTSANPT